MQLKAKRLPSGLIYGLLYLFAALPSSLLTELPGSPSPIWLSAGVALAGVLRYGFRVLPWVWIGAFLSYLLILQFNWISSIIMSLGAVGAAAIARLLIGEQTPTLKLFYQPRSTIRLLLYGILLSPVIAAAISISALTFTGQATTNDIGWLLTSWWMGDVTGNLTIGVLLLAGLSRAAWSTSRQIPESAILFFAIALTSLLIFAVYIPEPYSNLPLIFLLTPLIFWGLLRLPTAQNGVTYLIIALIATWGTHISLGPFVRENHTESLLLTGLYIITLGITILIAGSILSGHRRVSSRLALSSKIVRQSPDGIIVTDPHGILQYANPAFYRNTSYTRENVIGHELRKFINTGSNPEPFDHIWADLKKTGRWQGEVIRCNPDGGQIDGWLGVTCLHRADKEVSHYIGVFPDMAFQKEALKRVSHQAYYDSLTGLPNRQLFNDRLQQALGYAKRHNNRLALIYLDLDRFKNINDSLGHDAGDQVLQEAASRLQGSIRQIDTLARLSGDEFTVIVQDIRDDSDIDQVANKIIQAFKSAFTINDQELFVAPSIGISQFPRDGESREELLKRADTAMYRCKEQGGAGYEYFLSDMSEPTRWNLTIETALRRSIEKNEINVLYQPQFDLRTGNIIGLEALARWHEKGVDDTPPAVFINIAEETGLIHRLGEHIMEIACTQLKQWHSDGIDDLRIAVNVSPVQLRQPDYPERLRAIVERIGISPTAIELEITETSLMENAELMESLLNLLSSRGFQIAIDDFGTGYSSLSYLKKLSLDRLKIDASFIHDIPKDSDSTAICKAIIDMAHSLKLKVLAEGVEDEKQLNYLRKEHCNEIQGYYYSKPITAQEVTEMIRQGYWITGGIPK